MILEEEKWKFKVEEQDKIELFSYIEREQLQKNYNKILKYQN